MAGGTGSRCARVSHSVRPRTPSRLAFAAGAQAIGKEQGFSSGHRESWPVAAESLDPQKRAQCEEEWMDRAFARSDVLTPTGVNDFPEPARSKES